MTCSKYLINAQSYTHVLNKPGLKDMSPPDF
jgi:hypothetical protein